VFQKTVLTQDVGNIIIFLLFIICGIFHSSLTACNTSFFTRSAQLIFSILLQHHISKLRQINGLKYKANILQISTQPLKKWVAGYSWGQRWPVRKGDDLTAFIVPKIKKIRSLNLPEPLGPPRPVAGHLYLFLTFYKLDTFQNIPRDQNKH
jgi:hypothetical protein